MTTTELVSILLSVVGAVASVWFILERMYPLRRLSWRFAETAAKEIASQMRTKGFDPTLVVGIGRGGAIIGSLISGCMGHRPLLVVDRKYIWVAGRRTDDLFFHVDLPQSLLERVLLVAGEAHSGNTMRLYYEYMRHIGARDVKRAVFVIQKGCTEPFEFIGMTTMRDLRLPWMFAREYARDSRSETEARTVGHCVETHSQPEKGIHTYLIVRHGRSTDNEEGDRYSGISESLLTEAGLQQAKCAGRLLQKDGIQRIVTSPMKRTVSTAREIQALTGASIVIDNRLKEIDFGEWEGLTRKEVHVRWPELYNKYKTDPVSNCAPGGESPQAVLDRLRDLLRDLQSSPSYTDLSKVVLVTHNTVARILLGHLAGAPLSKYRERRIDNASISKVQINDEGKISVVYENCTTHLENNPTA